MVWQVISKKSLPVITGLHFFVDGNKRTGIATAIVILRNEVYRLTVNDKTDFMWLWQRRRRIYRLNRLWIR
jgi:prophage maintenance system killer protein